MTCEAEVSGKRCEEMVVEICESLGYSVFPSTNHCSTWDLMVNGLRVQVKKRTTRARHGSAVEMKTSARGKAFAYRPREIDVFVFYLDGHWSVVPSAAMSRDDGSIPNRISVKLIEGFRDAWHAMAGSPVQCERQLGFDF
jgi:hypothetical protein